jgi:outer membrane immunogenic protein
VKDNAKDGVDPGPFDYSPSGAFGGATAGYNIQRDRLVFGIEGDIGYMDLEGTGIIGSTHAGHHQDLTLDGGVYGDITGRIGVLITPATLVYGKGGFAFYDGEATQATTNPGYAPTGTDTFTGWVAGGGVEHFIAPNLSIKVEYLHFDFGTQEGYQTALVADPPTAAGYKFRNWTDLTAESVKVGIAYHF